MVNDCTTNPASVTLLTAAAGVNVNVTLLLALGSSCPKPQLPKARPTDGALSTPTVLLAWSARKPLNGDGPLSVTVAGTPCVSVVFVCARPGKGAELHASATCDMVQQGERMPAVQIAYREAVHEAAGARAVAGRRPKWTRHSS